MRVPLSRFPVVPRRVRTGRLTRRECIAWIAGLLGALVAALAVWAGFDPVVLAIAGASVAVLIAAFRKPEWCLIAGLALAPAGGDLSGVSAVGLLIVGVAGLVALARMIISRDHDIPLLYAVSALLLAWLAIRYLIEGSDVAARSIVGVGALLPLAVVLSARGYDLRRALTAGAAIFLVLAAVSAIFVEQGARFAGYSGNPNRMVFSALIAIAALTSLTSSDNRTFTRITGALLISMGIAMVAVSGSQQGYVGLAVLALCCGAAAISKSARSWFLRRQLLGVLALGVAAGSLAAVVAVTANPATLEDYWTLSGRTPIFFAAFESFLQNPVLGTGLDSVTFGEIVERSAHSSILAVFAGGGVFAGLSWIGILAVAAVRAFRSLRSGDVTSLTMVMLLIVQSVQTVQFSLWTWIVLLIAFQKSAIPQSKDRAISLEDSAEKRCSDSVKRYEALSRIPDARS